jgi:uncharacterized protein with GYD domain
MAKYMIQATYTSEGVKGLLKDGGTGRRAAIEAAAKAAGGRLEAIYFAFGETDVFVILDGLDTTSAAGVGLTIAASGAVRARTTVLLTPDEVDIACRTTVSYSPPGQANRG